MKNVAFLDENVTLMDEKMLLCMRISGGPAGAGAERRNVRTCIGACLGPALPVLGTSGGSAYRSLDEKRRFMDGNSTNGCEWYLRMKTIALWMRIVIYGCECPLWMKVPGDGC